MNELQYEKLSNAINQIVELAEFLGECNNKTRPEFTREASEIIHKDGEIDDEGPEIQTFGVGLLLLTVVLVL